MTTIALPSLPAHWLGDMLTEKDLLAETDLASLPQQSNDFGRWGESNLPKEEWERDLQQVIRSLSDYIENSPCSWDLSTYAQGSMSATMVRS
jgi:hypothetical protein